MSEGGNAHQADVEVIEEGSDDEYECETVEEGGEEDEDDDEDDDDDDDDDQSETNGDEGDERESIGSNFAAEQEALSALFSQRATAAFLQQLQRGDLFISNSDGRRAHLQSNRFEAKPASQPTPEGVRLKNSGEFSEAPPSHKLRSSRRYPSSTNANLLYRESSPYFRTKVFTSQEKFVPNTGGRLAVRYSARAYSGQFSQDGSFFYTCAQDFRVRLYDTMDPTRWRHYKTVIGETGRWTITDANLSPDNKWVAYSSITPVVYMARTDPDEDVNQELLDFRGRDAMGHNNGIWSLRFSGNGHEIVVGASDARMYVYDIEAKRVTLNLTGHFDDVNAVCFADPSSNVLFSGSDDSFIKVWDRRSMSAAREAGVFVGHMEGITFISPKGDGRYLMSNGKDQTMKLWDIRKLTSRDQWDNSQQIDYSCGFDYRHQEYPGPKCEKRPDDCSVMTYRGHSVLKTLIRCGFSPISSTGQQYLYSGSDCGRVFIWNLDGTVHRTLDLTPVVSKDIPTNQSNHGRQFFSRGRGYEKACIRDASWHPYLPVLVSTSWHGEIDVGSIYLHEWSDKGSDLDKTKVMRDSKLEEPVANDEFWQ